MNESGIIEEELKNWVKWSQKIGLYLLCLVVFLIPHYKKLVPPVIAVSMLTLLIAFPWKERVKLFRERLPWIALFASLYLFHLIGMIYSENQQHGWLDVEIKMSLFLMPVIILSTPRLDAQAFKIILRAFLYGCLLAVVFSYGNAFYQYLGDGDNSHFYYAELAIFHHPTYYSMYLNLAVIILIGMIFERQNKIRIDHFVMLAFFIITIYQLASRAGILALGGILLFTFVYYVFPRLKWVKSFLALLATFAVAAIVIYNSNFVLQRFDAARQAVVEQKEELKDASSAIRLSIWEAAIPPIKEHWLLGVGTGDVKDVLMEAYEAAGLDQAKRKRLNAHNQYVQVQLALGLPATLVMLLGFLLPFIQSVRRKNIVYSLFLFTVGFNLLLESALETQGGVVFYSLINALLMASLLSKTSGTTQNP